LTQAEACYGVVEVAVFRDCRLRFYPERALKVVAARRCCPIGFQQGQQVDSEVALEHSTGWGVGPSLFSLGGSWGDAKTGVDRAVGP